MFHKIIDVHTAVFKYFSERISEELGVNVRYARKSSFDYSEEQPQQIYPCVAIQDYAPVPRENWWIEYKPFHRATSEDGKTGYVYYLPLWMDFRYDISIASKSYKDYLRMQQWFLENTIAEDEITLESFVVGGMETGEPISITTRTQDIPSTDGVYETNYEITFAVWLYAREPVGIETVQNIVLRLNRVKAYDAPNADFSSDFNRDFYSNKAQNDFSKSYNKDFATRVCYNGDSWLFPNKRLTDLIAQMLVTIDGYSGIRDISQKDYDALKVKDPDMIYIIQ